MSTNTYLFSIKAFSIFDIFSAAYVILIFFNIFIFRKFKQDAKTGRG